jgi:carbohydrate kinase (thermoresistant glucokinase family)
MQQLIQKYSTFRPHQPRIVSEEGRAVLVTGATGSLGAHVVAQLVKDLDIDQVICLVRASSPQNAKVRVISSMHQRGVYHTLHRMHRSKIIALPADLGHAGLGISAEWRERILCSVERVIHLAWAVNFNMEIQSFEKQHIAGVHNLIQTCLDSRRSEPASFHFGSSVSSVAATPHLVKESIEKDLSHAQGMGYARSKLVAENICFLAASKTGMTARVHRIGQVVGDTQNGVWNSTEAIPLMIQSATTIGALPKLDEYPSWLPVDVVAQSMIELSSKPVGNTPSDSVFHIVNPSTFHWTKDLLPALHASGLIFEEVDPKEWVRRLRESNADPVANPPFKLVDFFAGKYEKDGKRPRLYYNTDLAAANSATLHSAPRFDNAQIGKFVKYWQDYCWAPSTPVEMDFASSGKSKSSTIIIIAGPCGSGKTTVANAITTQFSFPLIEADHLHSPAAVRKMALGQPLEDQDRWYWLTKIKRKFLGLAVDNVGVVVTCSALKKSYRDLLREVPVDVNVQFLMLEADRSILMKRVEARSEHFMKTNMVDSQIALLEEPNADEVDVLPVDVSGTLEDVVEDLLELTKLFLAAGN